MDQLVAATLSTRGLRLAPVVDGKTLPGDPFDPTAPALSADVPLLIGSTEFEVNFFPNTKLDPIDDARAARRREAGHARRRRGGGQADRRLSQGPAESQRHRSFPDHRVGRFPLAV